MKFFLHTLKKLSFTILTISLGLLLLCGVMQVYAQVSPGAVPRYDIIMSQIVFGNKDQSTAQVAFDSVNSQQLMASLNDRDTTTNPIHAEDITGIPTLGRKCQLTLYSYNKGQIVHGTSSSPRHTNTPCPAGYNGVAVLDTSKNLYNFSPPPLVGFVVCCELQ